MQNLSCLTRSLLVASLILCAYCSAAQARIELRDAIIAENQVRLSALLPQNVDPVIVHAAEAVTLGPAPNLGETRAFTREQILLEVHSDPLLPRILTIPGQITVRRRGYPLTRQTLLHTLSSSLQALGADAQSSLQLPGSPQATVENPALQLVGTTWNAPQARVEARVRCTKRDECGNFLVYVEAAPNRSLSPPALLVPHARPQARAFVVSAGQHVNMLLEDDGRIRISAMVTCLQSGSPGQIIRVFEPRGRRVFHATVLTDKLLRATSQPGARS